jgi:hypothetical protein
MSRGSIDIPVVSKFDPTGIKQAQGALKGFGKSLIGIGALVAGAFAIRGIANFAMESVLAAERAEQFNNILRQVAETTDVFGDDVDAATDRMIKFADAHEMVIGVEAELIKEAQGVLLSFKAVGESGDEVGGVFDRATKAAFDMAAVLKTDARSSAVQLGKALENPIKGVTALGKAGTTFTDQQREQIRVLQESGDLLGAQAIILNEVESQYGGAAEAAALSSEKIKLGFGQIQDALGNALAPSFEKFVTFFIEDVVPPLTKFFEVDFPEMLASFATAGDGMAEALAPVGEALRQAFGIPEDVDWLEGLLDKIATLPENEAFMEFVNAIVLLTPELLKLLPPLTELVLNLVPLLLKALPLLTFMVDVLAGIFGVVADEIGFASAETDTFIEKVGNVAYAILSNLPVVGSWVKIFADIAAAILGAESAFARWLRTTTGGSNTPPKSPQLPGVQTRANGGRVNAGMPYLVGEMGPELFMPGRGGNIVPNDQLGRGGGGATYVININANVADARLGEVVVNAIKRYERTSGPVFASA